MKDYIKLFDRQQLNKLFIIRIIFFISTDGLLIKK